MAAIVENEKKNLDEIDVSIICILSRNANITATELSERIRLSIPATNKRISKLIASGIIDQYTVILNPEKIGKPLLAFIFIVMERLTYLDNLMEYVQQDQDVLECYAIAGEFDYILKVRAKNMMNLEKKIISIKEVKGVMKTNTIISLYQHKFFPTVLPDRPPEE